DASNRRDVANEIEPLIERRVDRLCRTDHEQRVSVCGRAHDGLGSYVGTSTRSVLNDEWLAKSLRQPLPHRTCNGLGIAASGKADEDAHRPRRVGLRRSEARHGRQRGSAHCQMQKISAGKFHLEPPFTSLDHLELGRLHERQVGGFCAFEKSGRYNVVYWRRTLCDKSQHKRNGARERAFWANSKRCVTARRSPGGARKSPAVTRYQRRIKDLARS